MARIIRPLLLLVVEEGCFFTMFIVCYFLMTTILYSSALMMSFCFVKFYVIAEASSRESVQIVAKKREANNDCKFQFDKCEPNANPASALTRTKEH